MNGHGYQGWEVTDGAAGGWRSAKRLKHFEA
jgi:hypothetical protein